MRRNRVLVLTMFYEPEPNFITADVARELAKVARVTVITPQPNYPLGHFYPGIRGWLPSRRVESGVVVWRLPFFPDHSTSVPRRAFSYLSFVLIASLFAPFVGARADVVWVYHGPFTTAIAALWFRFIRRRPIVLTSADLWPESLSATGVLNNSLLLRMLTRFSRAINRMADVIVCSTRGTLARYAADGILDERLEFVPVWVDGIPEELPQSGPSAAADSQRIIYAGNLGPAQGLDTIVKGAALLRDTHPNIAFELYGAGASEDQLKALAREMGAVNVTFLGRRSPAEIFALSSAAFAQVVCLKPTPLFRMTVPSKLSFTLAAGAPVLYGLEGEAAEIARESGGGIAFDATSPESFATAVRQLAAFGESERIAMRERARSYYSNRLTRRTLLRRYGDLFRGLLQPVAINAATSASEPDRA